jgi:hypothetical protein
MGYHVFYDRHETANMWGKDAYVYLREIYYEKALYTIMFISPHYAKKLWPNHERESAQARAFSEHSEYILPARFDDTPVPGLLPTTFYVDLRIKTPEELADLAKQKLGRVPCPDFLPNNPDRLLRKLAQMYKGYGGANSLPRMQMVSCAKHAFHALSLMTPQERQLVATAAHNFCPHGWPNNMHLRLDYFSRCTGHSTDEIRTMLSRIRCL